MRFTRLRTPAFGALEELDTGDEPLGDLVVVEGRNEAGKSTFFELLCVLLYGFHPASRESYPYAPWSGGVARATGTVRLESEVEGAEVEVRRRLLSSPRGSVRRGHHEEKLRNRPLPWVDHVPRTVFRQVFAVTLSELAALRGDGWATVQDRLLGTMGASDLRSARDVVEELQAEAGSLWRPNRRGRQAVREVQDRIRALRLRRREVLEEEERIRSTSEERSRVARELEGLRKEREAARIRLEGVQTILPVARRLERIAELEARGGLRSELAQLPESLAAHRDGLLQRTAELHRRIREVEEDRREPDRARESFRVSDREVLAHRREVEERIAQWAGSEPARARRALLVREIRDRERRIEETARSILDREPGPDLRASLRSLRVQALHTAVHRVHDVRRTLADREDPDLDPVPGFGGGAVPAVALTVLGVALLALGQGRGVGALGLAGGLCLGGGLGLFLARWSRRRDESRARQAREGRRRDREARQRELAQAEAHLAELLEPLGPGPGMAPPGPEFPMRLEGLREWIHEEDDRREELARIDAGLREAAEGLQALTRWLPEEEGPAEGPGERSEGRLGEPGALAHLLERALRRAGAREAAADAATRELARLDRMLEDALGERARLEGERAVLDARLSRLGGGDPDAGLTEVEARRAALRRAAELREELERDHPDLEALEDRIRRAWEGQIREEGAREDQAPQEETGSVLDPEAPARHRARLAELEDRIEEHTRRLQALEKDLEFLGRRTRLDEVDGEILALRRNATASLERRDRLWVLSRIVQEAERRIRHEHQPAVLREASAILGELTGGRYDGILLAGREGRDFRIHGPAARDSLPVAAPLSTGTREQVYLALRLAILDQLDRSGERLPLFLDEVLVNWDPERREAGLRLLARRARGRQCFFFTCHPDIADRLVELGGTRVSLPSPTG